jgi:6-phosphogluconolactonase (cycloisomerase 2 family)
LCSASCCGEDNISGFTVGPKGTLDPLASSTRMLSEANTGPAQVAFARGGDFLVVTEKTTNLIDTFLVDHDGYAGSAVINPSSGMTPFGFATTGDFVLVTEADSGAMSSYELEDDGNLAVLSASVPNNQAAPCWAVVTRDGNTAFTANTPDDSLSAYAVHLDGHLSLLHERAGEPGAGTGPLDTDLSDDGGYLYTLDSAAGAIGAFDVMPDGTLDLIQTVAGIPAGANGMAAR